MAEFSVPLAAIELAAIISSKILDKIKHKSKVSADIECIKGWLQSSLAFLDDQQQEVVGSQVLQQRVRQIRALAHEIEDTIDEFTLLERNDIHKRRIIMSHAEHGKIRSKIDGIRKKVDNMRRFRQILPHDTTTNNAAEGSISSPREEDHDDAHFLQMEDDIVGFEREKEDIISQLLSAEPGRTLISLVGPAGSGKTALAKHVYESTRVRQQFDYRALVSASCPLTLKKVLKNILVQFGDGMDGNLTDMAVILKALEDFRERSYLIVLDDVWSRKEYESVVNALPAGSQYSRIIITSRMSDVASSCWHKHELNGLSEEKALTLLCKKAFRTSNCQCPPELEELTKNIAKTCEGLPLHLVDAGVLLSSKTKIPSVWKNVYDRLGAELPNIRSRILPSYKDLTSNLKICLLYFSIFPENYSIQRERLKRLWIAEGFVNEDGNRTREDAAEDYLNELARRNLIHVCARNIDGRVKSCRLLNLVHQFIVCKAKEENFIKILSERSSESTGNNARRLSVNTNDTKVLNNLDLDHTRSAFLFARASSSLFSTFKLLKVLEMQGAPIDNFPEQIVRLVLLRYLSLRQTNITSVPKSIKQLALLETLDLRHTLVSCLPKGIRKLRYLRHLLVYHCDVKNPVSFGSRQGAEISTGFTGLRDFPNIQKLSLIKASKEVIKSLSKFTKLRKLGLVVLEKEDGVKICESIQKMEHLSTLDIMTDTEEDYLDLDHIPDQPGFKYLQSLYLKGRLLQSPGWISALQSLIKIRLKWSRLNICPLVPLQTLPNLMQLELINAYSGKTLEFKENTFPKLKVLHIQQLDELSTLALGENAISKLEKLKISRCEKLEYLPSSISKLTHLEELLLGDIPENFIKTFQRASEEFGMMNPIQISYLKAISHCQRISPDQF